MTQPITAFGFATYEKAEGVETKEFIKSFRNWQQNFMLKQEGIIAHWLFGNLEGGFADCVLARDLDALGQMAAKCESDPHTPDFLGKINMESIKMCNGTFTTALERVPEGFSCLEFGSFSQLKGFGKADVMKAIDDIQTGYLSRYDDVVVHALGQMEEQTYCEMSFARTIAGAQEICEGYVAESVCANLLKQCDPDSLDLDFWYLLA